MGHVDMDIQQAISRCLAGERPAFAELHAAHAPGIGAFFLRSGFAPADAEDLTQETFMRAFRSLATFDADKAAFSTWLGTIARNVARKQWQRRRPAQEIDDELAQNVLADENDPLADMANTEALDALVRCMEALDADLARLVRLRYVQALTTRGIAKELGIPESTARLRLTDAHQRLQRCMNGKGFL